MKKTILYIAMSPDGFAADARGGTEAGARGGAQARADGGALFSARCAQSPRVTKRPAVCYTQHIGVFARFSQPFGKKFSVLCFD